MAKSWQQQREQGSPFLLAFLTWVALRLGRRVIFVLLCFIVFYYFLAVKTARRSSREFLSRALNRSPHWWEIYRHLLTFAVVSIDRIYFLAGREAEFDVNIHGHEVFDRFAERGCILLTSHLGSFDVMRVLGARRKALSIRILLDIKHNANALNLLQQLDPELARGVIDARTPAPELALLLSEAIEQSQLVGIMADRCAQGERAASVNFMGEPVSLPQGLWQLAAMLKAPVIACFGIYNGANRYDLHFELIREQLGTNRKDRALAIDQAMALYAERLEYFARTAPYNWFNFYDYWQHEST